MATTIRPELSQKNKYYIDKHRYYELKHFCLQYPLWKKAYSDLIDVSISLSRLEHGSSNNIPGSPTEKCAIQKLYFVDKIKLIEETAMNADNEIWKYILRAVTEDLSYTYLKQKLNIPCGRDMYYDRYRKFFWLLNEARD